MQNLHPPDNLLYIYFFLYIVPPIYIFLLYLYTYAMIADEAESEIVAFEITNYLI